MKGVMIFGLAALVVGAVLSIPRSLKRPWSMASLVLLSVYCVVQFLQIDHPSSRLAWSGLAVVVASLVCTVVDRKNRPNEMYGPRSRKYEEIRARVLEGRRRKLINGDK